MSWAEDMGYDAYDLSDIPDYDANELHWKKGIHYDIYDNQHRLSEMTASHLQACIKKWPNMDTTPLQKELDKRYASS